MMSRIWTATEISFKILCYPPQLINFFLSVLLIAFGWAFLFGHMPNLFVIAGLEFVTITIGIFVWLCLPESPKE